MTCRGSATITRSEDAEIHITVSPTFLSTKEEVHWFSYHIIIANRGKEAARLLSRYWHITDGNGEVREVQGAGVVGEQPVIDGGQQYQYTSYVDFTTPVGYMQGMYIMETINGSRFQAPINLFSLSLSGTFH